MQNTKSFNVPFTSVLPPITDIAARNKAFDALEPEQQRREIAYEALHLVMSNKVGCDITGYWDENLSVIASRCQTPEQLQLKLLNELPKCDVCERGLMMLAQIRLSNTLHPNDSSLSDGSEENIKGFEYGDFRRMENEYENSAFELPFYEHTLEKMMNICCNVIANGNFVVTDRNNYLELWRN